MRSGLTKWGFPQRIVIFCCENENTKFSVATFCNYWLWGKIFKKIAFWGLKTIYVSLAGYISLKATDYFHSHQSCQTGHTRRNSNIGVRRPCGLRCRPCPQLCYRELVRKLDAIWEFEGREGVGDWAAQVKIDCLQSLKQGLWSRVKTARHFDKCMFYRCLGHFLGVLLLSCWSSRCYLSGNFGANGNSLWLPCLYRHSCWRAIEFFVTIGFVGVAVFVFINIRFILEKANRRAAN